MLVTQVAPKYAKEIKLPGSFCEANMILMSKLVKNDLKKVNYKDIYYKLK